MQSTPSTLTTFHDPAKLTFAILPTYLKRLAVTFDNLTISSFHCKDVTSKQASISVFKG